MNDKQSGPDLAQPLERGFEQLTEPFNRFVSSQTSGVILLLAGTLAALVFANTSLHSLYLDLVKIETVFFVKDFELRKTLQHWVNDGLLAGMGFTMSIFIAILSFDNQPELLTEAKASIIRATATAGLMGFVWLWFLSYRNKSSRNPLN
jgi:NhaA family Na+:H+ antiporter